jgi:hexosaminidase
MQFGKLNDHLSALSSRVTFENSTLAPLPVSNGDPLRDEPLSFSWEDVRDEGLELHISLGRPVFLDCVSLVIGQKTALTEVRLKGSPTSVLSVHRAETGKSISERTIRLDGGAVTDTCSLVLRGDFSEIEILSVELYGTCGEDSPLFPTPKSAAYGDSVPAACFSSYEASSSEERRAGEILAEKFGEITGLTLTAVQAGGAIRILTDPTVAPDGYSLQIKPSGAEIRASNLRGLVMGAEAFIKLTAPDSVRTADITDTPFLPFRGVHLFLPSLAQMEFARRLVKHLISPMGYNNIIIEVATGMKYHSHPEINAAVADAFEKIKAGIWPQFPHGSVADGTALEHDDIRAFVAYVRSFGIEVIPEVQSLGHVPYLTLAHPEIAEIEDGEGSDTIDTRKEDARPNRFYPHCYCPSSEKSYEILFDILDEIIEVFEPREYVHMGHDEVYYMGLCSKCKQKSHAELYASDVCKIYAHLKKKGYKMMIWSDMLQPVTKYQTPPAVDLIPKDILCLDFIWYFHLSKDIEDNLLEKGFKVAIGNLYSSHFPRYESRIRKDGMVGGQISAWVSTNEKSLQQEGKFYDLFFTAEMLWSESYTHPCRLSYDRRISKEMPALREHLRGIRYPSRSAGASRVTLLENPTQIPPMPPVSQITSVEIPEGSYQSLIFTHTMLRRRTRLPWKPHTVAGIYRLTYTDGTEETIPITVGGNIAHWNRRQNAPMQPALFRHTGYTACYETDSETTLTENGDPVTFYRYEHILPKGKVLLSVALEEDHALSMGIVLRSVEGIFAE